MGGTSCFNIISCGCINESVDKDDTNVSSQNKGRDKPGWSLRKKSAKHQEPSNIVTEKIASSEDKEIPQPVTEKIPSSEYKEILEPITVTEKIPSLDDKEIPKPITITEKIPASETKEIPEPITISSEPQVYSNISEETSDNIWTEDTPDSITKNATVSTLVTEPVSEEHDIAAVSTLATEPASEEHDIATVSTLASEPASEEHDIATVSTLASEPASEEHDIATVSTLATEPASEEHSIKCEPTPDESELESTVIVIQAAVRRFLAGRHLVKHRNVVKLQAAVRGHLVRKHAVGTLRCVQAIVKMQALVRARRDKGLQSSGTNSTPTYVSVEKLLSNRLARQLLESTPKTKQINIKCDPSKSDSAWSWLGRWMSASSPETLETHTPDHDEDKFVNNPEIEVKRVIISDNVVEATVQVEEKENLINVEEETREEKTIPESTVISDSPPDEPVSEIKPEAIPENPISETNATPVPEDPVSETKPKPTLENLVSEAKPKQILENPVLETETKHEEKQIASGQPDSDGRKRKASNPAFIAAQSRFEKLTSFFTNPKSPTSSNQDDEAGSGAASPADYDSSDPLKSVKSSSNQDDLAVSGPPADMDSSDPLRADNEVVSGADIEKTTVVTDVEPVDYLVTNDSRVVQNGGSECGTELSITSTLDSPDQSEIDSKKFEEVEILNEAVADTKMNTDDNNNNSNIDTVMPEKQVDQKLDDSFIELEPESNKHEPVVQLSAPESPGSHITTLESQGTPSSQTSTTTKKSKSDKKISGKKPKIWSSSKKSSPVRFSVDSGVRSSLELLPKDPKPVKRRNSFGSPKPDRLDSEQLVPSYMQATESARAKAVSSPRSSPDVHDKETYLKKRHSLPIVVNGRQGSPRIQRSMSQALQTTKGNSTQERKWQR